MATKPTSSTQQATAPTINPETGEVKPEGNGGGLKKIDARQMATNARTLKAFFEQDSVKGELAQFAQGFMKPEAMTRIALLAMSRSPTLAKCTLSSILRAMMDAAALRVRPGGLNGRGYLVPRKNNKAGGVYECHFDPGWRGLIDVARRSKQIKSIGAIAVREGDEFEYGYFPLPKLHWKPLRTGSVDRPIVAAFAVAELGDGAVQIEVLEGDDLDKIKKTSAAGDSGPWADWESEMVRKSAVKRLCKYLPVADEFDDLDKAMALSDGADLGTRVLDVSSEELPAEAPTQAESIVHQLDEGARGMSATDQLDALEREASEAIA